MNIVFDWSGTLADDHIITWNITNNILEYFRGTTITFDTYKKEFTAYYFNNSVIKYAKEKKIPIFKLNGSKSLKANLNIFISSFRINLIKRW